MLKRGDVTLDALAWKEGLVDWQPLRYLISEPVSEPIGILQGLKDLNNQEWTIMGQKDSKSFSLSGCFYWIIGAAMLGLVRLLIEAVRHQ